ncbi:glycosyltransferase family A protein [Azospirillum soli]|uniref:glycosyltransferase family A protein n=1 Tax=Azospirillum soli TaxID=1304799 RepID=UPI001FEA0D8E|nr:glycosyltransferase family A protein [Azospirillum soli]MBP2315649.1 glycosyltransferase involved in cell wall biosynthesis [Azospirillum soli]
MSSICLNPPAEARDTDDVRAAIVVPTYKHSGLLAEALDTALAQETDFAYAVVVVNDGCPFPETDRVCREFAAANPGRLFYLHKRNGGLSAARNSGIAFALDAFPALEAVYFLDSDNRIRPHLLQRMLDALRAGGPEVGWAYPDVDKFGFFEFCDMSGPYSPLEHLFRNVSEAGSMASRRLLDAGLRFDEAMRQGSEDWEFWLQGLERGFRGVHVPYSGFGYRRRGESMLTESERDYRPILTHIQGRHPKLFAVKAIAKAEAAVGRRYAVYLPDKGVVRCVTDPTEGGQGEDGEDLPLADFARCILRAPERPDYAGCPGHLTVMDSGLYGLLLRQRLLQGVLWTLERAAAQAMVVSGRVTLEVGETCAMEWRGTAIGLDDTQPTPLPSGGADVVALETRILLDLVRSQPTGAPELERDYIKPCVEARLDLRLCVPGPVAVARTADTALASLYEALAAQWSDKAVGGWASAQIDRYRSGVASPRDVCWQVHQLPSVLPVLPKGNGRTAALVVEPGAAEKLDLAMRLAGWLRGQGWEPHLVAMGSGTVRWSQEAADLFGSIIPFPAPLVLPERPLTRRNAYLGTPVPGLREEEDMAAGTLAAFDLVVTIQHGPAHSLMGRLRKLGVTTWAVLGAALGLAEEGRAPADVVNACAAFEHAYQTIVPLDARTFRLCQALALPLDKLRRWEGEEVGDEADWRDCPALSPPAVS